jgi:hypothetical protein
LPYYLRLNIEARIALSKTAPFAVIMVLMKNNDLRPGLALADEDEAP